MTDIMSAISKTTWAPPFVFIDRIVSMDKDTAVALTAFNGPEDRFRYGAFTSPSLLIEAMAQLSLVWIRSSDPAVEIGVIPSLREIVMSAVPEDGFQAVIRIRWAEGTYPRYSFDAAAYVMNRQVCTAKLDILATRRDG